MSADQNSMDVDAMTMAKERARKGKAKGIRKDRCHRMRSKTQRTTCRTETVSHQRSEERKLDSNVITRRVTIQV